MQVKRILLLLSVTFFFCMFLQAKEIKASEVPDEVKACITKNYPEVRWVEWDYNKKRKTYKADFYIDAREYKLVISSEGELLFSRINLFTKEVPQFAYQYIRENYKGAEIIGGYKLIRKNSSVYYVVDTMIFKKKGKMQRQKVMFDEEGNYLNVSEKRLNRLGNM